MQRSVLAAVMPSRSASSARTRNSLTEFLPSSPRRHLEAQRAAQSRFTGFLRALGLIVGFYVLWAVIITPDGETSREWVAPADEGTDALDAREPRLYSAGIDALRRLKSTGR